MAIVKNSPCRSGRFPRFRGTIFHTRQVNETVDSRKDLRRSWETEKGRPPENDPVSRWPLLSRQQAFEIPAIEPGTRRRLRTAFPRRRSTPFVVESLEPRLPLAGFLFDRQSFLNDPGTGARIGVNFDAHPADTRLDGSTLSGVTFASPSGNPLVVTPGSDGIRYPLSVSTAPNVLSPGGSDPSLQDDGLRLEFESPVQSFGLDVVFDVPDGASYVGVRVLDEAGNTVAELSPIPAPSGNPGFQFVGYVSSAANIKSVVFDEYDPTEPDDNVAYDSLVFFATGKSCDHGWPGRLVVGQWRRTRSLEFQSRHAGKRRDVRPGQSRSGIQPRWC